MSLSKTEKNVLVFSVVLVVGGSVVHLRLQVHGDCFFFLLSIFRPFLFFATFSIGENTIFILAFFLCKLKKSITQLPALSRPKKNVYSEVHGFKVEFLSVRQNS